VQVSQARLRRAVRRGTLGVDVAAALNLIGILLLALSPVFLVPAAVALGYGESLHPFLVAAVITAAFGLALERTTTGAGRAGFREGFLVVALVWLLVPASGSLPYLLSGHDELSSPLDAYFEAMSGFTTTGASILPDPAALNDSMAFWRQLTVWLGGMGIIVLALAILPRLRVGGRQLFETEAPGPEIEPLTVTIREAARRFLFLYVGITVAEIVALLVVGATGLDEEMGPYDAIAHSFSTVATAGFSPRTLGVVEFGAATHWVVLAFMLVSGTNFALLYLAIVRRRMRAFGRDEEFRLYIALLAAASLVVLADLLRTDVAGGEAAVRHAVFNTASLMTTTGFASADFNQWGALTAIVLLGVMFIGASAGSTSGSIKVVRHVIIGKMLRRELDQTVHPELVAPLRLNRRVVDERALRAVIVFVLLYLGIAAAGAVAVLADSASRGLAVTTFDAIAASATTLGNVGPAFGIAGPVGSYAEYGDVSKGILTALMCLGRIEIIPLVVLLSRRYWRA
jgi:trk system potassium uptake protein TrkH